MHYAGVFTGAVRVSARRTMLAAKAPGGKNKLDDDAALGSAGFRQLVGLRGAAATDDEPLWKIRLQLTKPATWAHAPAKARLFCRG